MRRSLTVLSAAALAAGFLAGAQLPLAPSTSAAGPTTLPGVEEAGPIPLYDAATGPQWALLMVCGVFGSLGHYFSTRALRAADASATQGVKFVDLVWASVAGMIAFGEYPSTTTVLGGLVIFLSTTWIARREARRRGA